MNPGAGKIAQYLEDLCMHEDWNLDSQNPNKSWVEAEAPLSQSGARWLVRLSVSVCSGID